MLFERQQYDAALSAFHRDRTLRRRLGDLAGEARTIEHITTIHLARFAPDSAFKYTKVLLQIRRALHDRPRVAAALVNIGYIFDRTSQWDSAAAYDRSALTIFAEIGDHSGEILTLRNLGRLYFQLARPDSGTRYLRLALDRMRADLARVRTVQSLGDIASVFASVQQPDSALVYYRTVRAMHRDQGNHDAEARTLIAVAEVFNGSNQRDSASTVYREALAVASSPENAEVEALALHGLANLLLARNLVDSSLVYYRAALPRYRAAKRRDGVAAVLTVLGNGFILTGRRDSAITNYREVLRIYQSLGDRSAEAWTLRVLADLYVGDGKPDSAVAALRRASWLGEMVATTAPGDYFRVRTVDIEAGDVTRQWAMLALTRNGGRRPIDIALSTNDFLEAWGALERGRSQALRALRRGGGLVEDSTVMNDVSVRTAETLKRLARPGRAYLSFDTRRDSLLVLVIPAHGTMTVTYSALATDSLRRLVALTRAQFGANTGQRNVVASVGRASGPGTTDRRGSASFELRLAADTSAPLRLARTLLPRFVRDRLADATELVIIPDGPTSLVPWAALPMDSLGTPLGARYAIRLAPSLTALEEMATAADARSHPTRATLGANALVVGDPARPPGELGLPGARAEATWVADTLFARQRVTLLVGRRATVRAVRARLGSAPLIHLATHATAFPDVESSRESFLQFADAGSGGRGTLTVGELLDAAAARQLRLRARLIVLSACETGVGAPSATEGILGLQRAFMALGAETMIVSLWKVDDAATRALMGAFYTHWLDDRDHPTVAEALRRAQADMRDRKVPSWQAAWAKPNAWAAFQVIGAG